MLVKIVTKRKNNIYLLKKIKFMKHFAILLSKCQVRNTRLFFTKISKDGALPRSENKSIPSLPTFFQQINCDYM